MEASALNFFKAGDVPLINSCSTLVLPKTWISPGRSAIAAGSVRIGLPLDTGVKYRVAEAHGLLLAKPVKMTANAYLPAATPGLRVEKNFFVASAIWPLISRAAVSISASG